MGAAEGPGRKRLPAWAGGPVEGKACMTCRSPLGQPGPDAPRGTSSASWTPRSVAVSARPAGPATSPRAVCSLP